jgi:cobalt-zinc-cadmium resistance protein CzcA
MFTAIIRFSLENKLVIGLMVFGLIVLGLFSANKIPLDAVPDITNNQVQIVTTAPTFAPEEVEQLITYPIESGLTNIPRVEEVRSISRYGLSVITVVFDDNMDVMLARQYVQEQLNSSISELPMGVEPELMPITTGLGEIYQYVLTVDKKRAHEFNPTELRTIQDWIIKRQLNGVEGIIETSSFGGYLKQYEVALDPRAINSHKLTVQDVLTALEANNANSGGSYIEKGSYSFYIRLEGRVKQKEDIEQIPVAFNEGIPVLVKDLGKVDIGSAKRYGAMTMDGQGEVVGGITLMLKGGNSSMALKNVKQRIAEIEKSLPDGVGIYPYLDRSKLIGSTIKTARNNLIEGGLIVIFVLLLLLGNFRAGLIVASVIPLSMLFALIMMHIFGVSANLMSLGAIDFGIVIDGAVIIVEALLHTLALAYVGRKLSQKEMDEVVMSSTSRIYRSAAFGVMIILLVFVPILALEGTEGKTFRPMAQTVAFAILGSLLLSLTYVPVMSSLFLKKEIKKQSGFSYRFIEFLKNIYRPVLGAALRHRALTLAVGILSFVFAVFVFSRMGAEFIPTLDEGDIAMQQTIKPGSSLKESIHTSTEAERILLENFPEIEHVVSKIGTAEVPTDPMAIEDADIMIILKDRKDWVSADNREELIGLMKEKLKPMSWASFEFTQPIQLRFNELMTGAKSDVSVKIFGEDVDVLKKKAEEAAQLIHTIQGAADVKVDQTDGLQQVSIEYDRTKMAQYGVSVKDVNQIIRAAFAGEYVGNVYEQERKFDLVVRFLEEYRQDVDLDLIRVHAASGQTVPISSFAKLIKKESPMLISREQARRFINIGVNVRNRDVASLVKDIRNRLSEDLELPAAYEIQYGGQFENLKNARNRMLIAVPAALFLILFLLFLAFGSFKDALVIFIAVPLSAVGGIMALKIRGMPFSISSAVGFIALFGISVLNGIVLISAIKQLGHDTFEDFKSLISEAAISRLRPVLMTALVASFGFLPMALSTGSGAEVQRPLATVVIGGLISSTLLTLVVLPCLYYIINRSSFKSGLSLIACLIVISISQAEGQGFNNFESILSHALENDPELKNLSLESSHLDLERKTIGQWSPLEFSYQGGQINYEQYDHNLVVNQNISQLFGKKQKRDVIDREKDIIDIDKLLYANELQFQLKALYDQWQYAYARSVLIDTMASTYARLSPMIELMYETGELDRLSLDLHYNRNAQYNQKKILANQELESVLREIKTVAYLPEQALLNFEQYATLPMLELENDFDNSVHLQTFSMKEKWLAARMAQSQQENRQPELNLGYFMQSLEREFGFQGLSIGVGIPLDKRTKNAREGQLRIEMEQLANERVALISRYQNRIDLLSEKINMMEKYFEQYNTELLPVQKRIFQTARLRYEEGETHMEEYARTMEQVMDAQMKHLDQIRAYNLTVLELIYLTQKMD